MKLYTEEQVKHTLQLMGLHIIINEFIKKAEPIELPSDYDIKILTRKYQEDFGTGTGLGFEYGAKWMREQILNQNK